MITISEPDRNISKLWSKPQRKENEVFRLMKYVMRDDYKGNIYLHNVVTGQLVVLDESETHTIQQLPAPFSSALSQLVDEHFVVPNDFDEHRQVVNMRNILARLEQARRKDIVSYTILTTTACNARCYYCFEKGSKIVTMTEQTADDVVEFISNNCGGKKIFITWFGGEPTLAASRIDQICQGLRNKDIDYSSRIITNGYLFDEEMVKRAKSDWHLVNARITIDGTEEIYNRIKNYVNTVDNAYQRVMRNVGLLLNKQICVIIRMNFDIDNYKELRKIVKDLSERFSINPYLMVSFHQINDFYKSIDEETLVNHGSEAWFADKMIELLEVVSKAGFPTNKPLILPKLCYLYCNAADNGSVTISPDGFLVSCPEQYGEDQRKGDLKSGITNRDIVSSWKRIADYERCQSCVFFPKCLKVVNCAGKDRCFTLKEKTVLCIEAMRRQVDASKIKVKCNV